MFYSLKPFAALSYVVVVVSNLLATKITHEPVVAEMKNPAIPAESHTYVNPSIGERSVRPILEYRFDTEV